MAERLIEVLDNDISGVSLISRRLSSALMEGGIPYVDLDVRLTSKPSKNVTVKTSTLYAPSLSVANSDLVFNETDWNIPKSIRVRSTDNDVAESRDYMNYLSFLTESEDLQYKSLSARFWPDTASRPMTIRNEDESGIRTSCGAGNRFCAFKEGSGSRMAMMVSLKSKPVDDVQLQFASLPNDRVGALVSTSSAPEFTSKNSAAFSVASWITPQQLDISYPDNNVADARSKSSLSLSVTSLDVTYSGIGSRQSTARLGILIDEASRAGIQQTVNVAGSSGTTREDGLYNLQLRLASKPLHGVQLFVSPDDLSRLELASPSESPIAFGSSDWQTWKSITLRARSNHIDDSGRGATSATVHVAAVSADPCYDSFATDRCFSLTSDMSKRSLEINLVNTDVSNPELGNVITAAQEGGGDVEGYFVRYTSRPTVPVRIDVLQSRPDLVALRDSSSHLWITGSSWFRHQGFRIAVQGDWRAGSFDSALAFKFRQTKINAPNSVVTIVSDTLHMSDDDTAAVLVSLDETAQIGPTVREGALRQHVDGGARTCFSLNTQPASDITIRFTVDAEKIIPDKNYLVFTSLNWMHGQCVGLNRVNEYKDEGHIYGFSKISMDTQVISEESHYKDKSAVPSTQYSTTIDDDIMSANVWHSAHNRLVVEEPYGEVVYSISLALACLRAESS